MTSRVVLGFAPPPGRGVRGGAESNHTDDTLESTFHILKGWIRCVHQTASLVDCDPWSSSKPSTLPVEPCGYALSRSVARRRSYWKSGPTTTRRQRR
jgi:hypothetical protein